MGGALGVDDLLLDMEAEEASGCLFVSQRGVGVCVFGWRGETNGME